MLPWLLRFGALAAFVSLLVEFGFPVSNATLVNLHWLDAAVVALLSADVAVRLLRARRTGEHLRAAWIEIVFVALLGAAFVVGYSFEAARSVPRFYLLGAQAYLVAKIVLGAIRANEHIISLPARPAWILVGSFALLILVGTALLLLPNCKADGVPDWSFIDALFTSTSACCVTGLSVRDVGHELSFRGQAVLLALIQAGGLGIVTLAMFFTFLQSRKLHVHQMTMVRDLLSVDVLGDLGRFLVHMLVVTLFAELLGAAVLFQGCADSGLGLAERAWWGLFHSISAFCNAGFGLESDNLTRYAGSASVSLMVAGLVIVGGLGFPVVHELLHLDLAGLSFVRRLRARRGIIPDGPPTRLSLNAKLVLATTAFLVVAGTILFFLCERQGTLAGRPMAEQALTSFFQAVMPRTAGFNSLDVAAFGTPALLLIMVLMLIGASPCSTGGGIKTTSVAVLVFTVRAILRNRDPIDAFGRSVPRRAVNAAVAIVVLYLIILGGIAIALLLSQPDMPFRLILFESISALSTVGLSIGASVKANAVGRLILCVAMLVGRVGPLAVMWSVVSLPPAVRYEYPEEGVVVS